MSNRETARAWVEIDLAALRANYQTILRAAGPGVGVIAMVKADGYGLGAVRIARALEPLAPWGYGVATAEEGIELREAGITRPILVIGPLPPAAVPCAARARLTASISDLAGLDRWRAAAAVTAGGLDFHVEIDTGIGRGGFDWRATSVWAAAVHARLGPQLRWSGAFTQFHSADAPDRASAVEQWRRFGQALAELPVERGALLAHVANSAAALRFPGFRADAVRPGIYLYGGDPAPGLAAGEIAPVRRVVAVRTRLVLVRDVPPGATVGYGATHVAQKGARWGTLAIGYADGLPRALSNRGGALVRGRRVPIVGRISMDLTVVDLSGVPEAEVGDVVTLVGRDGDEEITPEAVAAQAETINYEILTGLAPRLPRVEVDDGVDR